MQDLSAVLYDVIHIVLQNFVASRSLIIKSMAYCHVKCWVFC